MNSPSKEHILDLSETEISNEENDTIHENKEISEADPTKYEFSKDALEKEILLGKTFKTVEEAYQFYNAYARVVGFSVRKNWASINKASKTMIARIFCCSCEGQLEKHPKGTPSKSRAVTRTGCMARFQVKLGANGNYNVTEFITDHNHKLASQDKVHLLRSQRKIQPAQAGLIDNMQSAGLGST